MDAGALRKICEGQQRGWYQAVSSCAVTRGQSHRMQRPEDDGSAQHVGGHGLVGHHSVARTSGARENSPGLKADGLACVAVGPAQSRWEGYAPTDYSRRGALPETARRNDHSVAPGATDRGRQRRSNRQLWRRPARAAEAVAGRTRGPASSWECLADQSRWARPEEAQTPY